MEEQPLCNILQSLIAATRVPPSGQPVSFTASTSPGDTDISEENKKVNLCICFGACLGLNVLLSTYYSICSNRCKQIPNGSCIRQIIKG